MNELTTRLSELIKAIKAPKYFILGIVILFLTLVLLPLLKILAIIIGVLFVFISFNPGHDISRRTIRMINKFK